MVDAKLCEGCIQLLKYISGFEKNESELKSIFPYTYAKTYESILGSMACCDLCEMIASCRPASQDGEIARLIVDHDVFFSSLRVIKMGISPICRCHGVMIPSNAEMAIPAWICGRVKVRKIDLMVLADPQLNISVDSLTYRVGRITSRPSLVEECLDNALQLVRQWVDACLDNHSSCKMSLMGDIINKNNAPIVANRILDVGSSLGDQVKLLKTKEKGLTGRYCTLSHRWGQNELCTYRDSERRFFHGIASSEMPKTFRDSVAIVRALGIRYLWIDSLCIVQDSAEHWQQESAKMDQIYRDAFLRIAASGDSDASQGCFVDFPTKSQKLQVPYYGEGEEVIGSFFIRAVTRSSSSDYLMTRGWVYQEELLARRSVDLRRPGPSWQCSVYQLNERGRAGIQELTNLE